MATGGEALAERFGVGSVVGYLCEPKVCKGVWYIVFIVWRALLNRNARPSEPLFEYEAYSSLLFLSGPYNIP